LAGEFTGKIIFIGAIWATIAVKISLHQEEYLFLYQVFEIVRNIAWYVFLLKLFDFAPSDVRNSRSFQKFSRKAWLFSVGLACLFLR